MNEWGCRYRSVCGALAWHRWQDLDEAGERWSKRSSRSLYDTEVCVLWAGEIWKNPLDYGTTTLMWLEFNGLAVLQQFLKHMGWKDFTFDSKPKKRNAAIFESVYYRLVENVWKHSSVLVVAAMFIAAIVLMSLRRTSENFPRNCPTTLLVHIPPPETGHGLDAVKWQMVKRISCQRLPWWFRLMCFIAKQLQGSWRDMLGYLTDLCAMMWGQRGPKGWVETFDPAGWKPSL